VFAGAPIFWELIPTLDRPKLRRIPEWSEHPVTMAFLGHGYWLSIDILAAYLR
jgi:hypothetical protein